jgi:hypothetical protein
MSGRACAGPARNPLSEQQKAIAAVALCQVRLRHAQDTVRGVGETLRRAVRSAENAEGDYHNATHRLSRFPEPAMHTG